MTKNFFTTHDIMPRNTLYLIPGSPGPKKGTLVKTTQDLVTVPYSIKTVVKKYRMLSNINESFVRHFVYQFTKKKNLIPIPIYPNLVLMPVKIQIPGTMIRVYGYVNVSLISSIDNGPSSDRTGIRRILFQDKTSLTSPQTLRSLEHNLLCAKFVREQYFMKCSEAGLAYEIQNRISTASQEWEPI